MKIAFFWTWEFSKNILQDILQHTQVDVWLVVSQPDKPVGRKKQLLPTPVKQLAADHNIPVLQPEKLKNNTDFFTQLVWYDFIVVVAYGKIVPKEVLEAPKYGCINIHGSILPKYRWASPIQESIKNGDTTTWLTIMYMSEAMDEGDILSVEEVKISTHNTTQDIFEKFEKIWAPLLIKTLTWIINGEMKWHKQDDSLSSYCSKITKEDGQIDFHKISWKQIYDRYRAYHIWPWIYTYYQWKKFNIEKCELVDFSPEKEVWSVVKLDKKNIGIVCRDKKLLLLYQIKLEWKKSMDILSLLNWNKDFLDYKF